MKTPLNFKFRDDIYAVHIENAVQYTYRLYKTKRDCTKKE